MSAPVGNNNNNLTEVSIREQKSWPRRVLDKIIATVKDIFSKVMKFVKEHNVLIGVCAALAGAAVLIGGAFAPATIFLICLVAGVALFIIAGVAFGSKYFGKEKNEEEPAAST